MFIHHINPQHKEKTDGRTARQDGTGHVAQELERSDTQNLFGLACVRDFVRFHKRDPRELGDEEIKAFLHHLIVEKKASQSTVSQMYSALKFFYTVTLEREWNETGIPRGRRTYKLPVVLSKPEVEEVFAATASLKYRTIFATIYSAGLRLRSQPIGPHALPVQVRLR